MVYQSWNRWSIYYGFEKEIRVLNIYLRKSNFFLHDHLHQSSQSLSGTSWQTKILYRSVQQEILYSKDQHMSKGQFYHFIIHTQKLDDI